MQKTILLKRKKISGNRELLEHDLRKMIHDDSLDFAKPIPTETALCQEYGLCRNTVRKVLQILTDEGLLRKRHGLGTFIIPLEKRSLEFVCLHKIVVFLPEYTGNTKSLNQYDRRLLAGIADYAFSCNGKIEIRTQVESVDRLIDQYKNLKFDGIIWERPDDRYRGVIEKLNAANVPQVTISRTIGEIPAIYFDYRKGINDVVNFLYLSGHRNIVFTDLPNSAPIFNERQKTFTDALGALGIDCPEKFTYKISFKNSSLNNIEQLFTDHPDVSAIFCSAPLLVEIHNTLVKKSFDIPKDITLVSLGGSSSDQVSNITFLREPREKIGWRAAELLCLQKTKRVIQITPEFIAGELIMRQSCALPKKLLHKIK